MYYPQSNGKAEATVKSMKHLIHSAWNGRYLDDKILCQALLQYRNTPSREMEYYQHKMCGHPVQDTLLTHRWSFTVKRPWHQNAEQTDTIAEASQDNGSLQSPRDNSRIECNHTKPQNKAMGHVQSCERYTASTVPH